MYPDVSIRVLYQRDYLHLLVKYGLEPPSQLVDESMPADAIPLPFSLARRNRPAATGQAAESA
jgi:hypothetical protein